jgi:hypothetical protein
VLDEKTEPDLVHATGCKQPILMKTETPVKEIFPVRFCLVILSMSYLAGENNTRTD